MNLEENIKRASAAYSSIGTNGTVPPITGAARQEGPDNNLVRKPSTLEERVKAATSAFSASPLVTMPTPTASDYKNGSMQRHQSLNPFDEGEGEQSTNHDDSVIEEEKRIAAEAEEAVRRAMEELEELNREEDARIDPVALVAAVPASSSSGYVPFQKPGGAAPATSSSNVAATSSSSKTAPNAGVNTSKAGPGKTTTMDPGTAAKRMETLETIKYAQTKSVEGLTPAQENGE